jgi:hypothetical protein
VELYDARQRPPSGFVQGHGLSGALRFPAAQRPDGDAERQTICDAMLLLGGDNPPMGRSRSAPAPGHGVATRDPTAAEFAAFLEQHPAELKAWGAGEEFLYPFLAWLEAHAVVEQRARVAEQGTHLAALTLVRPHHNTIGICVAWALRHMVGRPFRAEITDGDRLAVFELQFALRDLKNPGVSPRELKFDKGIALSNEIACRVELERLSGFLLSVTEQALALARPKSTPSLESLGLETRLFHFVGWLTEQ